VLDREVRRGVAGAPYSPGLLAQRIGGLIVATVRALSTPPDVLLLDATARDHPRGAGLTLHLGAELGMPTVGIIHRRLLAQGEWPDDRRGDISPLRLGDTVVGCWMRTRPGVRPLVVHPGWRVDLTTAVDVVASTTGQRRTPEPLRRASPVQPEALPQVGEPACSCRSGCIERLRHRGRCTAPGEPAGRWCNLLPIVRWPAPNREMAECTFAVSERRVSEGGTTS
jgi:deoxyinosine 3'endonuclease (endonuclease V)